MVIVRVNRGSYVRWIRVGLRRRRFAGLLFGNLRFFHRFNGSDVGNGVLFWFWEWGLASEVIANDWAIVVFFAMVARNQSIQTLKSGAVVRYYREAAWRRGTWWVYLVVDGENRAEDVYVGRIERDRVGTRTRRLLWNGCETRNEAAEEILRLRLPVTV